MYLLSQIKRNPAITTVTKRGIFGGGRGLLFSSLRNIKALLIYESGSLGLTVPRKARSEPDESRCLGRVFFVRKLKNDELILTDKTLE